MDSVPKVWSEQNPGGVAIDANPVWIEMKQNAQVINQPQYPIPYMARQGIQIHLQRLYDLGILRRIRSAWNTPLLPVKKPGSSDYRPVQDLRKVNNQVADLVALVPNPYSILAQVSPTSKWYSVIDLKDAFFSVPVAEECQKIFAFTWENAQTGIKQQYTWTRLPQEFKHSPTMFGEQLAKDLKMYQVTYGPVIQYVDDLLLFRDTYHECAIATLHLLKTLYSKGYRASKKKAQICELEVEYLGFQIREGTRCLGISRTSSIRGQPVPTCKKELRAFLGAAGYCRLWIANYAVIAQSLYDKLRGKEAESQPFQWETQELTSLQQLKDALIEPPALGLPDVMKPFHLFVDEKKGMAIGVLTQTLGSWERPVAYLSKGMDNVAKGWPGCLRSIAAACLLIPEAVKLTFGQTLNVTTPHTIQGLLETHGPKWMTNSRLVKYQALLCETPEIQIQDSKNLNPATLMPAPEPVAHDCEEVMTTIHSSRPDLRDQPWQGAWTLFTDGSSQVIDGIRVAGYAVVSEDDIIEAESLPPGTSAQKAELIALTRALQLAEGQTVNIYTDSKYAFLTIQVHGALYKERGFLTAEGKQLANASEIHQLLDAVWAPQKVAVMHCKAHTGKSDPVAKGNQWADKTAKEAARAHIPYTSATTYPLLQFPTETPTYSTEENEWAQSEKFHNRDGWWILQDNKIWIPEALAWTIVKEAHNKTHLGRDALIKLLGKTYYINKIVQLTKHAISQCITCARNNPRTGPGPIPGHILRGTTPFQVCQIDFTHMTPSKGYKAMLVAVCTYTGWIEATPTRTETAKEIVSLLLHQILPRYGLPRQINSDNGPAFTSEVIQQLSRILGIKWHLHCAWRPQSSGAVERANRTLKNQIAKLCQETKIKWPDILPLALLHIRCSPRRSGLTPYEMMYARPPPLPSFPESLQIQGELSLNNQLKGLYNTVIAIQNYTCDIEPIVLLTPTHPFQIGDSVWVKDWDESDFLKPRWKGPYTVLLTTPTAVKVSGCPSWIHWTRLKPAASSWQVSRIGDNKLKFTHYRQQINPG
ncbi:protein NYNRIN-like [Rhinatrema bivittatum]|uniref:protein NYNRIN-like n=1 Tax=Rhinatrema bivittatum TaxID=194408 RepID=UPI00112A5ACC|nr:protein NYNRIN-like [Rhinatrema bivittatum]